MSEKRYFPYLDALRFFVILGVMLVAYIDSPALEAWWLTSGVRSFFLLSGFFSTMVIARLHDSHRDSPGWLSRVLEKYYLFRIFRIFPIYYAIVLGALLIGMPAAREYLPWFLTFTQNFVPVATEGDLWIFSHFWSLAVLEQFYLFFPVCFLWARRWTFGVPLLAAAAILTAMVFRTWAQGMEGHLWLLPAQSDAFGWGVLVGLAATDQRLQAARRWIARVPAFTRLALAGGTLIALKFAALKVEAAVSENMRLSVEILFIALVVQALTDTQPRPVDRLFRHSWLCHLGVISYGMYAFKNFAGWVLAKPFAWVGVPVPENPWVLVPLYTGFTMGCALLSWHCFEKHVLARRGAIVDAFQRFAGSLARVAWPRARPLTGL